jgi:hypothetical protein
VPTSSNRRAPRSLPVGPVLAELIGLAEQRHDGKLTALFGDDDALMRVVFTAKADGRISPLTVDRLFKAGLISNPEALYGAATWSEAVGADNLPVAAPRSRHRRVRLADCQAVYDQMAATAVDGRWVGLLARLIEDLAAAGRIQARYQQLIELMAPQGWIVCRQPAAGRGSPSVYELRQRPEAQRWPCAGPGCSETITNLTSDGFLRRGNTQFHSKRCAQAAEHAAYGARLDRLRRAAELPLTGRTRLTQEEIGAIAARLAAPQRPAPGGPGAIAARHHRLVAAREGPR